jgi:1-acyl-sn-glycerol-3-phosphate acyltransferase
MNQNSYLRESALRKIILLLIKPISSCLARIQVIGDENIPVFGKVIIASNHLSSLDGFILQLAISRPLFFMGKAEAFKNPFSAWFLKQLGVFPVERGVLDRRAIGNAYKVLDSGLALAMFPEGTRTYGKGLVPARNGVSHIAIKTNSQIAPVTIIGAEMILRSLFKRAIIQVIIHKPIIPLENQTPASLTEAIMRNIALPYPPSLRGIYN